MMLVALTLVMASNILSYDHHQGGKAVETISLQQGPEDKSPDASIASLLDRGAQLGDPFPLKNASKWMPTERNAAKAASIHNLAIAARKRGLDRSDDLKLSVAAFQEMLLAEKLMQTLSDGIVIDEKEVRARFDRHPDLYDEFELSHIFIPFSNGKESDEPGGKAAARQQAAAKIAGIEAKLKAGADFAATAQSQSYDRESASEGGRLPAILGVNVQPGFLEKIARLKDGEISGVVEGNEGYHLIMLNRRRHLYSGPARDTIEREIRSREMTQLLPKIAALEEPAK